MQNMNLYLLFASFRVGCFLTFFMLTMKIQDEYLKYSLCPSGSDIQLSCNKYVSVDKSMWLNTSDISDLLPAMAVSHFV